MTTARHTVLRIPELLEAILLQLTPLELIKSQRVSKSFQAMIRQSPSIQRRLGFRLPPNITSEKKDATRNPLLDRFLSPTSFPHRAIHSTTHWRQRSPRWQATRISVDIEAGGRDLFVRLPVDIRVLFDWRKPSVILSEPRHDAYRDMLIADSPVDVYIWRHKFGHKKIAGVGDGRVLTCGELVEKCHEYFRVCEERDANKD